MLDKTLIDMCGTETEIKKKKNVQLFNIENSLSFQIKFFRSF